MNLKAIALLLLISSNALAQNVSDIETQCSAEKFPELKPRAKEPTLIGLILKPIADDLVPMPPELPPGLPPFELSEKGLLFPPGLDLAISQMLAYCQDSYPKLCRTAIEEMGKIERTKCDGKISVLDAQYEAAKLDGVIPESKLFWLIGGIVFSFAVGINAGYWLSRQ